MLDWTIVGSLIPSLVCLMIGLLFGVILFGAAAVKSTGLVLVVAFLMYMAILIVGFVTVSPLMLVPFALIDGIPLLEAISVSLKLSIRHLSTSYLVTFVALAIGTAVSLLSCGALSIFRNVAFVDQSCGVLQADEPAQSIVQFRKKRLNCQLSTDSLTPEREDLYNLSSE